MEAASQKRASPLATGDMPAFLFAGALNAKTWHYADGDHGALLQMGRRIAAVGKRRNLIHYSELVRGITVRLPNIDDSHPFELGVPEWRDLDRAILGDFLGRLCVDSYSRGQFLASALVTSKETKEPSEGFWNLVTEIGMLRVFEPKQAPDVLGGAGGQGL